MKIGAVCNISLKDVAQKLAHENSNTQAAFFDAFFESINKLPEIKKRKQLIWISEAVSDITAESMEEIHASWNEGVNGPQDT